MNLLITRMLDDLYWVMSYSRWQDERYWPAFSSALKREHPSLTDDDLLKAKEFNRRRYYFQGIGGYEPDDAIARGLAQVKHNTIVVVVVIGEAMQFAVRENPGRDDTLDYDNDNDNDNDTTSIPLINLFNLLVNRS